MTYGERCWITSRQTHHCITLRIGRDSRTFPFEFQTPYDPVFPQPHCQVGKYGAKWRVLLQNDIVPPRGVSLHDGHSLLEIWVGLKGAFQYAFVDMNDDLSLPSQLESMLDISHDSFS